jgi:hypothetical protein
MKTIFALIFITMSSSIAEYRVYQYLMKNKIKSSSDQQNAHIRISTLDPVSFIAYNGGNSLIDVDMLRTWMCPGYTGHGKEICKSPYGKVPKGLLQ